MENNLDQLFRNKLSDHKVNPSAQSWENLEAQLSRARWGLTQKRLAVAASLMLFMSVIGVAYYYLGTQKSVENPSVSEKIESVSGNSKVKEPTTEPPVALNKIEKLNKAYANISKELTVQIAEAEQMEIQSESMQQSNVVPFENADDLPLLAEVTPEVPMNDASNTMESQDVMTTETALVAMLTAEEPLSVTITYKANKNSKLVTSQKANVIQEGIEKIAGFAEELVQPDEIKTKLRNTTGDLLALNFGKLINKQNKDN